MMEEATAVLIVLCLGGLGLAYGLYYIISVNYLIIFFIRSFRLVLKKFQIKKAMRSQRA
jgi:hypothetical protein